jgi:antitoxin component of MazEF toxin-antitoxin module
MATFQPLRDKMKIVSGNNPNDAIKVSLPKDALKHLGWKRGDTVKVSVLGKTIVLQKVMA